MRKRFLILFLISLVAVSTEAQPPSFFHLGSAEGLSDNYVNTSIIDRNGILWIGTTEGLNSFDGNRIYSFNKYNYPSLADNTIDDIVIDPFNNLWIKTATRFVTMVDENRKFHLIGVGDSSAGNISDLFYTSRGMVAVIGHQPFICKDHRIKKFEPLGFPAKQLLPARISFTKNFSEDKIMYYGNNRLVIADFADQKILLDLPLNKITNAAPINKDELLAYTLNGDVFYRVSISQKKVTKEYRNLFDQYNQPIEGNLRNIARIDSNLFVLTSRFSGLYYLDISKSSLEHYVHDPLDDRSIGGNNTYRVRYDTSGYLMVTTQTSGLHYYNIKQKAARSKPYFIDEKGKIFDGYIQCILTDGDMVWLGSQDRLIKWDRKKNTASFIPCYLPDGTNISNEETVRALQFDSKGNLWVGTSRFGILVLDKGYRTIKQFIFDSTKASGRVFPSAWINAISTDHKGNIWVGTLRGVCMIDQKNSIHVFNEDPVLKPVTRMQCTEIWIDKSNRVWMGTISGVYCYDQESNNLRQYSVKNGLPHNVVHAINEDDLGNIYIGTSAGLSVLDANGNIFTYNRGNGLKNDKCEGILKDENGQLWIGNLNCILRYDPVNKKFAVFEEGHGFSHTGFRMRCCYMDAGGEMFWGSDKGLVWFYPRQIETANYPLRPSIHSLQVGDTVYRFTGTHSLNFPYNASSFAFRFSSGELTVSKKSQVLYRLEGFDDGWKAAGGGGEVIYSKLPPGNYNFQVRSSADGILWYDAAYPVSVHIQKPWWGQAWFKILISLLALAVLLFVYRYNKKIKEERTARLKSRMEIMELNVKMAESRFSNLRLQMNPHFLFNSLSSIQHLIVTQQTTRAYKYLTVFSNFLRSLLNYADRNFIPLEEELKILNMYMELESLRFDQSFRYEITVDDTLANEVVLLPTLMVQPFAENAIWHGLLHKAGEKKLSIRFSNSSEDHMTCIIEDNGIGRNQSAEIKKGRLNSVTHESKGIAIIRERLDLMQQKTGKPATVDINDLVDDQKHPAGTRVTITIPYYNPERND